MHCVALKEQPTGTQTHNPLLLQLLFHAEHHRSSRDTKEKRKTREKYVCSPRVKAVASDAVGQGTDGHEVHLKAITKRFALNGTSINSVRGMLVKV